jgi:hypothetical protein
MINGSRSFGEGYDILLKKIRARYGDPRSSASSRSRDDNSMFSETHEPTGEAYWEIQRQVRIILDDVFAPLKRLSAPNSSSIKGVRKFVEFYCAVDRAEQRLIEGTIEAIAGAHPDYLVINHDKRLPITEEAYRFTQDNARIDLRSVRMHYAGNKRHDYVPSALFVNVKTKTAYLVDYKRNRTDEELEKCRLDMQCAGLLLPYWLYDRCNGLHIRKTITSIVTDSSRYGRSDYREDKLSQLDHVLYVRGAEIMMEEVRTQFAASVKVLER